MEGRRSIKGDLALPTNGRETPLRGPLIITYRVSLSPVSVAASEVNEKYDF